MVLAHAGLARLSTPRMVWDALPFDDRPFLVKTWTYAAATVPLEAEAFARGSTSGGARSTPGSRRTPRPGRPGADPRRADPRSGTTTTTTTPTTTTPTAERTVR